jgi:tetratricopeptide (TPR) repeat protein
VLVARSFLAGRRTQNRIYFDAAVDAQHTDARAALSLWLKCLESGDVMAHYSIGYTLYELGQFRKAYDHLRHYTELAPGHPWNWCWYGRAAEAVGEDEEAVQAYERATELDETGTQTDAGSLLQALLERQGALHLDLGPRGARGGYDHAPMTIEESQPVLGERFEDALMFAARNHRRQRRKGGTLSA